MSNFSISLIIKVMFIRITSFISITVTKLKTLRHSVSVRESALLKLAKCLELVIG